MASPRSARYVLEDGARRGCGLRPPRNLRAQRAPAGISISSSTDETILSAVILRESPSVIYTVLRRVLLDILEKGQLRKDASTLASRAWTRTGLMQIKIKVLLDELQSSLEFSARISEVFGSLSEEVQLKRLWIKRTSLNDNIRAMLLNFI